MPRKKPDLPPFRVHKATGQGYVNLNGHRVYLGRADTPEAKQRYTKAVAEWLGSGGQPLDKPSDISIVESAARYWRVIEDRYPAKTGKGKPRGQAWLYKASLDVLAGLYGDLSVSNFGPLKFQAVRNAFVRRGVSRGTANKMAACIKRAISWGVSQELVPPSVYHGLQAVKGLRRGDTTAPDHPAVTPVAMEHINAVQAHVSRQVWALIQLQLRTAARAGELVTLRPVDINMTGRIWVYSPGEHKTAHHGHKRTIYIGPVGQEIIRPFLTGRPVDALLFSLKQAEVERREAQVVDVGCSCGEGHRFARDFVGHVAQTRSPSVSSG